MNIQYIYIHEYTRGCGAVGTRSVSEERDWERRGGGVLTKSLTTTVELASQQTQIIKMQTLDAKLTRIARQPRRTRADMTTIPTPPLYPHLPPASSRQANKQAHRVSGAHPGRRISIPANKPPRHRSTSGRVRASDHERMARQGGLESAGVHPQARGRARQSIVGGRHHRRAVAVSVILEADVSGRENPAQQREQPGLWTIGKARRGGGWGGL